MHSLALDNESISELGLESLEEPWVDLLVQYRRAARQQNGRYSFCTYISITLLFFTLSPLNVVDPSVIFQASLSCAHLLLSTGTGGHMTVTGMLNNGRTLMAMASLMFAPVPLEEVCPLFREYFLQWRTIINVFVLY